MAGIYLHIPFCKQACVYCDFHFSTNQKYKQEMVDAMCSEMDLRKNYLHKKSIDTIYFGGGTPSLLTIDELNQLLQKCRSLFNVSEEAELTLEANPDDISLEKVMLWKQAGINRISIGIQSFSDADLKFMNRSHNAHSAVDSVMIVREAGIENITADLIYGIPGSGIKQLEKNLEQLIALNIPHISAYALTVEPKTILSHLIHTGKTIPPDDSAAANEFLLLTDILKSKGYIPYEISNFGKPGYFSKHNSSYWKGMHFLGIGPSAHSFDGVSREFNIRNNPQYISGINSGLPFSEKEVLSPANIYNEYIMTGLRTIWGVNEEEVLRLGSSSILEEFLEIMGEELKKGRVSREGKTWMLTDQGKLFADAIAASLFQ